MTDTATSLDEAITPTEAPQEAAQETPAEQPADEVKAEEQPEVKGEAITVPLKALQEERDARQNLARELEAIKQTLSAPKEVDPEPMPDPIDDPQGYAAYMQRNFDGRLQNVEQQFQSRLLDMSEAAAIKNHGVEAVESAKKWALSQPASVQAEIRAQADPYDYAIQQHNRETVTAKLTADPAKLDKILKMLEAKETPAPTVPGTTAIDQSVGGRKGPEWSGPTPLDNIL